jgi:hypothetical protein
MLLLLGLVLLLRRLRRIELFLPRQLLLLLFS